MKRATLAITTAMLLAFLACKQQANGTSPANNAQPTAAATTASTNLTPEQLGELGAKIKKNPKDADQILAQHGLTQQSFVQAVRKVAESPEQSKRYTAAYKKTTSS